MSLIVESIALFKVSFVVLTQYYVPLHVTLHVNTRVSPEVSCCSGFFTAVKWISLSHVSSL